MRFLLPVLLLLTSLPAFADEAPLSAQVTLSVTGKDGAMYADYVLSRPVTSLGFARKTGGLRAKMWRMETPGLDIQGDAISSSKPFDRLRIRILPYADFIDLNYAVMQQFSDGSVSLYTGYFNLAGEAGRTRFSFTSPDRPVVAYGKRVTAAYHVSPQDDGTFVYFGGIAPLEAAGAVLILDPGMPAWVHQSLTEQVPAAVAFYTAHYGAPLPQRPFLLFNWTARDQQARDYKGDTLPGTIDYILSGSGWSEGDAEARSLLAVLITHELSHFWNAYLFHPADQGQDGDWLPEGQSQTAAIELSLRSGWISQADALQLYASAVNDCLQASGDRPIQEQTQSNEAIYGCGVTFNLLAEAALHRKDTKLGFFDLWHAIYAAAHKREYSEATFMDAVHELSGDDGLTDLLHGLVTASAKDKNPKILAMLKRLGIGYTMPGSGSDNPEFGRIAITPVMAEAMRTDCKGSVSFSTQDAGFLLYPVRGCRVLGKSFSVQAVDGHSLFAEGISAYQAVEAGCAKGEPIRLTVKEQVQPLLLACPAKLPSMPDMVDLTSLPWLDAGATP